MEAIVNNLIKATGWSIFHSLWQGAVIYGILLFLVTVFPKLNSKIKHNLAYGAMCLMFIGFCITFFSVFKLPVNIAQTITAKPVLNADVEYLVNLPQQINSNTEHIFPYLVSVYAIGLFLQFFILTAGYQKLLKLKQAHRTPVPASWQRVFEEMVAKLNLHQNISFHLSELVNVPLVIGYLKPVVLFPIALSAQLDLKQVEAILIHELSHIRRNDYLLNLIKTGIETLLFFNPFIWLSSRFINIEREHACDDLVLKFTGTPVTYAHALLKLEILKDKTSPALSMAATGNNQHLYQRIKRITDMKTNYMNAKQQLFAITLTVATVISLAWISPAKTASLAKDKTFLDKKTENSNKDVKLKMLSFQEIKGTPSNHGKELNDDTTRKKRKFKIVTTDANGNKKEYNSIKEMPDSLRQEVIGGTFLNSMKFPDMDSLTNVSLGILNSPEFRQRMKEVNVNVESILKSFNSSEWKQQQAEIQKNALEMKKHFDSPEWKAQEENIKKQAEDIKKRFESPEWKQQQAEIQKNALDMRKHFSSEDWKKQQENVKKQAEEIKKRLSSPEFKKQIEEMKEFQQSPEYKELREKFDTELEKLKEKKGIKSDLKSFNNLIKDNAGILNYAVAVPGTEVKVLNLSKDLNINTNKNMNTSVKMLNGNKILTLSPKITVTGIN